MAIRKYLAAGSLISLLVVGACSSRPIQGVLVPVKETAGTSIVPILAVTTRRSTPEPGEMFSGERGPAVSFASLKVSIPPDTERQVGEVQWPKSLPADPRRSFVTVAADYLDKQAFTKAITSQAKRASGNKVIVFVHGFNNRFDEAVYRFAQVVHDSKTPAIPVLFTWPSRGETRLRAYTYDRESANYSRDALEGLLDTLSSHPGVSEITILAHSMGNWLALEALRGRAIRAAGRSRGADKLRHVMLVAPDVDVDVFRTQIQRIGTPRPMIALFVSRDDKALNLSQFIWDGMPRLGDSDPDIEPYKDELARDRILVFDLTKLQARDAMAHDKAFDDITAVMGMIKERMGEEQRLSSGPHFRP